MWDITGLIRHATRPPDDCSGSKTRMTSLLWISRFPWTRSVASSSSKPMNVLFSSNLRFASPVISITGLNAAASSFQARVLQFGHMRTKLPFTERGSQVHHIAALLARKVRFTVHPANRVVHSLQGPVDACLLPRFALYSTFQALTSSWMPLHPAEVRPSVPIRPCGINSKSISD